MAPKPKLTITQIGEIRTRMTQTNPPTQAQLAEEYGVGRTTIAAVLGTVAPAAPSPTTSAAQALPHAALTPNPRNPRKNFPAESIAELAHSIAENGLLQPLLVRQSAPGADYEIIAGERRWRAIAQLIEAGRHGPDIACIIREADDAQSLALSIIENLQREDVPVMEEAKAFAALHDMDTVVWSYQNIADAIGKTVRFVQQRVAIATKLHPHFQAALRENLLNIEGARILCQTSIEDQLALADDWNMIDDDGELELLGMDPIETDDARWAVDNLENAKRREREIAQHREQNARLDHAEQAQDNPAPPAKPDLFNTPDPPKSEVKTEPVTKAHRYHAHNRKTLALRDAVRARPMLAIRAACYALLTHNDVISIAGTHNQIAEDRVPVSIEHDKAIIGALGKTISTDLYHDDKVRSKLWQALEKLPDDKLLALFANVTARHIGTRAGHDAQYGDDPVAIAIARTAGLAGHEEHSGLTLEPGDLDGVRKHTLLNIADDAGTPAINDEMNPADIAAQILKHSAGYVLPTMRFATSAEIEKALTFK